MRSGAEIPKIFNPLAKTSFTVQIRWSREFVSDFFSLTTRQSA